MQEEPKPALRLRKKFKGEIPKLKMKIAALQRRVRELETRLDGGWMSDDGVYCDVKYAARYLNKSVQTLRNMKAQRTGPITYSRSGSVVYRIDELKAFHEHGYGQRDRDANKSKPE